MRLTFPYDWLLDQVLDGRKTASVLRPGEHNYGADPRDGEVRVGGEYDACDTRGDVRCRIRVTQMRELRWGEPIPEALWRAEACASEEEFRRDHLAWFSRPAPEYTFRAFWFVRIAAVLLTLLTMLAATGVPTLANANAADASANASSSATMPRSNSPSSASSSPSPSSLPPSSSSVPMPMPTLPTLRLSNDREVLEAIMRPLLETGLVADGTVFAGVRLLSGGDVDVLLDVHGGVYAASPALAQLVRDATARARFVSTDGPLPRTWAIFWTFQTNACRPWTYDAPPNATVLRVCLNVEDGQVRSSGSFYLVDALPPPLTRDTCGTSRFGSVVPYPTRARRSGTTGVVHARYTVDAGGKLLGTEYLEVTDADFRGWEQQWRRTWGPEVLARCSPSSGTRTFEVRTAFQLARRGTSECIFVLPAAGPDVVEDIRVCGSRMSGR